MDTPLLYVHSPGLVQDIKAIFAGQAAADELPAQLAQYTHGLSEATARRKALLKRKLAERDKLTVTADVAAPVILVPADRTAHDSPCLALSPGALHVNGGQIDTSDEHTHGD